MATPKPGDVTANGWNEYKRLVLAELERLDKSVGQLVVKHDDATRSLERSITASKDAVITQVTSLITMMEHRQDAFEGQQELRLAAIEKEAKDRRDKDDDRMKKMEDEVFTIKTKAAVWGGVAATLFTALIWIGKELIGLLHK